MQCNVLRSVRTARRLSESGRETANRPMSTARACHMAAMSLLREMTLVMSNYSGIPVQKKRLDRLC
jgi:hypothetical protein